MTNQEHSQYNSSRLFERGRFEITRINRKGTIVTKDNTTRKFCVELGSRAWGVGTPMEIKKVDAEDEARA